MSLTVIQAVPALDSGGVERGTLEVAAELVRRGHRAIVISAGGRMVTELQASGAEHVELPIGRKSLSSLFLLRRVGGIIRDSQADILHAASRFPAWLSFVAWRLMEAGRRPRFVTSVHGPYSVNPYSRIMLRGEQVIAISEYIRSYISTNYAGVEMGKVRVIPRGIDPDHFPFAYNPPADWWQGFSGQLPRLQDRCVLTLPARITRWKGQEDFIRMLDVLRKQGLNVYGLIVGGVEARRQAYHDQLKALAARLGLHEHLAFLGHRDDLKEIMSVSDIVLSLSTEPEAFGRTSLEALALGRPVIAYDHGGASEVLDEIFPQGLVTPLDYRAAAARVMQFYRAGPTVPDRQPFTLQAMLDRTIDVYAQLVETRRP